MKPIAIVGAGGLGREILMLVEQINSARDAWIFKGFFDDEVPKGTTINGYLVLGNVDDLNRYDQSLAIVVAVGSPSKKKSVIERIANGYVSYPVLIHPNAQMGNPDYVKVGEGTVIAAGSIVAVNATIGKHVFLNFGTVVGHDARIGDYTSVMPSVNINGEANIGEGVYLGVGAVILNQIPIGENSIIGAGSVVFSPIPPNCTALGNPARPMKTNTPKPLTANV